MTTTARHPLALLAVLTIIVTACSSGRSASDAESAEPSSTTTTAPTGCDGATPSAAGAERLTVPYGDVDREYERVIPPDYDGTTPHPLIVNLHGFTSTIEQQNLFSGLPEAAGERGYILITPQAAPATLSVGGEDISAPYWNLDVDGAASVTGAQDDVGFIARLIDSTAEELCVDDTRIYVTGNSNGAGMAATLACELPGQLAAIAPVSGINLAVPCDSLDAASVIAFHGDTDPLVPYDGGSAANVEIDNPSVESRTREFADAAGCAPDPVITEPFEDIEARRWTGCQGDTAVELYTVLGGGHTWPGMLNYVDAARLAELASDQRLVDLADVDIAAVAGHMTVNLEATTAMLDFFDAHRRP
jgi:polyhydroxybutyrate depolymerase